jgi:hypothetical protein
MPRSQQERSIVPRALPIGDIPVRSLAVAMADQLRWLPWSFRLPPAGPPCCGDRLSVDVVTMTLMSELPAGDTHDVIRRGGEVIAVVVPIAEYQQLRQAAEEQQVNDEFDAARAAYLARREAGTIRYVSHEEAGRRLGLSSR